MKQESIESRFGTPVRLTQERWLHISAEHAELVNMKQDVLDTMRFADNILAGMAEELLAVRALAGGKTLVVVYREVDHRDGFIITAFLTRRVASLSRRKQLWPSPE